MAKAKPKKPKKAPKKTKPMPKAKSSIAKYY